MSFTNNTRDEVTLIFLKHKYLINMALLNNDTLCHFETLEIRAENEAIRATFKEVRERNAASVQGGSYEEIEKLCEEFLKSLSVTGEFAKV